MIPEPTFRFFKDDSYLQRDYFAAVTSLNISYATIWSIFQLLSRFETFIVDQVFSTEFLRIRIFLMAILTWRN